MSSSLQFDRPLRVAFVDYVLDPTKPGRSGLSDLVWDMASELVNGGHEAHIIASYHSDHRPDSRVVVHNFPTPPIGYRNVAGQLWILKRAASIAKRLRPDVVHAPEYVSTAVLATLGVRSPLILTVPGNIYHRLHTGESGWYPRNEVLTLKWAARTSARRCSRVIAISQEMKRWWEWTGSRPERTPFIPLGVDTGRFSPAPDARKRLDLPEQTVILVYAGRLTPDKGLPELLEAVTLAEADLRRQQARIYLIGRGPLAASLQSTVAREGLEDVVLFVPWVPQEDLRLWYSAADALILPSRNEGLSRTIPEAMACGTPVIGTRITGTEDHVRDGQTGYLVEANNPLSLAKRLRAVSQDPGLIRSLRQKTLDYALEEFPWPSVMRRVIREAYMPAIRQTPLSFTSARRRRLGLETSP